MTSATRARHGPYTSFQTTALVTLRILIGWHFLYEGLAKLMNPYWTSAGYLADSRWFLKSLLMQVAASPTAVTVVDFLNQWGLVAIGLALLLGVLTRAATVAGVVLLALYWLAAPPFVGFTYAAPAEGSYIVVNKVLVELGALLVLLGFPTSHLFGFDRYVFSKRSAEPAAPEGAQA